MFHAARLRPMFAGLLFILLASFAISSSALAQPDTQVNQAYIAGRVINSSFSGVSGVNVTAYNTANYAAASTVFTNSNGYYLMLVDPGTYRLTAQTAGYPLQYYSGVYSYYSATDVIVGVGQYVGNIDFTLTEPTCISGRITYPNGGAASAYVYAYLAGNPPTSSYYDATYYGETNWNGSYSVCNLPPGAYRIEARDKIAQYANTFYIGALTADDASLVMAGDWSVNFSLLPKAGQAYVTGQVTDQWGWGINYTSVTAYNTADYSVETAVYTDYDGYYSMLVDPGTYRLMAQRDGFITQYYSGAHSYDSATDVNVDAAQYVSGINFALPVPACLQGYIWYPGVGPADATVYAYRAGSPANTSYYDASYTTATSGGWFSLCSLTPGQYRIEARDNNHVYPNTFYYDSLTALNASLITLTSGDYREIYFSFLPQSDQAFITGRVVDPNGFGMSGVSVTAYDTADYSVESAVFTDFNGYYSLLVDPATYRLSAEKDGYLRQYYASVYSYAAATDVPVAFAQTVENVDFTLTQPGCIGGTITDPAGAGLAAQIYVYRAGSPADVSYYDATYYGAANADGSYQVCNLTPGQYRVEARDYEQRYPNTFYVNSVTAGGADLVSVGGGQSVTGVNFAFAADQTGTPQLIAPAGPQEGSPAALSWNAVPNATWYYVWLTKNDYGTYLNQWYDGWYICADGVCSATIDPAPLPSGAYTWWVQAWGSAGGYGEWSEPLVFTVPFTGAPTPIEPIGAAGESVIFNWTHQSGAQWYNLWLTDPNGVGQEYWFDAWNVCTGSECYSPSFPVNLGTYRWWIRSWNMYLGVSEWSAEQQFARVLPAPTMTAPVGTVTTSTPTFTWNALPGGDWYYIWVSGSGGHVADVWYNGYDVCADGVCSVPSPAALPDGDYQWWIQAFNAVSSYGAWSDGVRFSVVTAQPERELPAVVPELPAITPEATELPSVSPKRLP
jgi:hypothetical protein